MTNAIPEHRWRVVDGVGGGGGVGGSWIGKVGGSGECMEGESGVWGREDKEWCVGRMEKVECRERKAEEGWKAKYRERRTKENWRVRRERRVRLDGKERKAKSRVEGKGGQRYGGVRG